MRLNNTATFILAVFLGFVALSFFSHDRLQPSLDKASLKDHFSNQVKAFGSGQTDSKTEEEIRAVQKRLTDLRDTAISLTEQNAGRRNTFQIVGHILSGTAIIATFLISMMGAFHGVEIQGQPTLGQLTALEEESGVKAHPYRKWILSLAAVSALCVAGSDRLAVLADDAGNKANKLAVAIGKADENVKRALETKDLSDAANQLETTLAQI